MTRRIRTAFAIAIIGGTAGNIERLAEFSKDTEKCAGKFPVASAGPRVVSAYDVDFGKPVPINGGPPRQIGAVVLEVLEPTFEVLVREHLHGILRITVVAHLGRLHPGALFGASSRKPRGYRGTQEQSFDTSND